MEVILESSGSELGQMAGFCDCSNGCSYSAKGQNFLTNGTEINFSVRLLHR